MRKRPALSWYPRDAHILGQIVTVLLDHNAQEYEAFTPITIDMPAAGGIEPDYCTAKQVLQTR